MKSKLFGSFLLIVSCVSVSTSCQNRFYIGNKKNIALLAESQQGCLLFNSSQDIDISKRKADSTIIQLLSGLYSKNDNKLNKVLELCFSAKGNVQVQNDVGLCKFRTFYFGRANGNFITYLKIGSIDSLVTSLQISISTSSNSICASDPGIVSTIDFKYISDHFLKIIDFPISVTPSSTDIFVRQAMASDSKNVLNKLKQQYSNNIFESNHLISHDDKMWFKTLTWFDDFQYVDTLAPYGIFYFVAKKNTKALEDILFSPNHTSALNAMEGLNYLTQEGSYKADDRIKLQMNILSQKELIPFSYDQKVYYRSYSDLKIMDYQMKKKFRQPYLLSQ